MIRRILFICYANTCRTPVAQELAKLYAEDTNIKDVIFDSAGFHMAFDYAQSESIEYVKLKGINMENFKPKAITRSLIEKQDLIIGMERYQLTKIRNKYKDLKEDLKGKLYTLKEFNGSTKKDINIPDPYKTGRKRYFEILEIVDWQVKLLVHNVKKINQDNKNKTFLIQ